MEKSKAKLIYAVENYDEGIGNAYANYYDAVKNVIENYLNDIKRDESMTREYFISDMQNLIDRGYIEDRYYIHSVNFFEDNDNE